MIKRTVIISGHSTSVALEPEFWAGIERIAAESEQSVNDVIRSVDKSRKGSLASALRVFVLMRYTGR